MYAFFGREMEAFLTNRKPLPFSGRFGLIKVSSFLGGCTLSQEWLFLLSKMVIVDVLSEGSESPPFFPFFLFSTFYCMDQGF